MYNTVYMEFLKIVDHVDCSSDDVRDPFYVWGEYDCLHIEIYNKTNDKALDENEKKDNIKWLKRQYEEYHAKCYDGKEHQPVFLLYYDNGKISPIKRLIHRTKDQNPTCVYVMTMLQVNFEDEKFKKFHKENEKSDEFELKAILAEIEKIARQSGVEAQAFFNLGGSDIAILFEVERIGDCVEALGKFREEYPVAHSHSMVIFPYRYTELAEFYDRQKNNNDENKFLKNA